MALQPDFDVNGGRLPISFADVMAEFALSGQTDMAGLFSAGNGQNFRKFKNSTVQLYNPVLTERTQDNLQPANIALNPASIGEFYRYGGYAQIRGDQRYSGVFRSAVGPAIGTHNILNDVSGMEYVPGEISVDVNGYDISAGFDGDRGTVPGLSTGVVHLSGSDTLLVQSVVDNGGNARFVSQNSTDPVSPQITLFRGNYAGTHNVTGHSSSGGQLNIDTDTPYNGPLTEVGIWVNGRPDANFASDGQSIVNDNRSENLVGPRGGSNAIGVSGSPAAGASARRLFKWTFRDTLASNTAYVCESSVFETVYFRGLFATTVDESSVPSSSLPIGNSTDPVRYDEGTGLLTIYYIANTGTDTPNASRHSAEVRVVDTSDGTVLKTFHSCVVAPVPTGIFFDSLTDTAPGRGHQPGDLADVIFIRPRSSGEGRRFASKLEFTVPPDRRNRLLRVEQRTSRSMPVVGWSPNWTATPAWPPGSDWADGTPSNLHSRDRFFIFI